MSGAEEGRGKGRVERRSATAYHGSQLNCNIGTHSRRIVINSCTYHVRAEVLRRGVHRPALVAVQRQRGGRDGVHDVAVRQHGLGVAQEVHPALLVGEIEAVLEAHAEPAAAALGRPVQGPHVPDQRAGRLGGEELVLHLRALARADGVALAAGHVDQERVAHGRHREPLGGVEVDRGHEQPDLQVAVLQRGLGGRVQGGQGAQPPDVHVGDLVDDGRALGDRAGLDAHAHVVERQRDDGQRQAPGLGLVLLRIERERKRDGRSVSFCVEFDL